MTVSSHADRRRLKGFLHLLFRLLGLNCLGGAVFLQLLVFLDIVFNGRFIAVEPNPAVLAVEVVLAILALAYYARHILEFFHS